MNTTDLPIKIRIASPCHARWDEMRGDHQSRFCNQCQKNVYNLSTLTTAEAAALIKSKEGNLCVRFYQRPDGTVLTEDCPVGLARAWQRTRNLVLAGVGLILFVIINVAALGRKEDTSKPRSQFVNDLANAKYNIKDKLGLNPPRITLGEMVSVPRMGKPAPPPAPPKSPVPQPKKN
jgi:hypothetical protein